MDIPLHPAVTAEIARGRELLERVRTARRNVAALKVTIPCPDGDNTITFAGDGMVTDAAFVDDIFDRYPGAELRELLLDMSAEGYAQVSSKVTGEVAAALEQR
ncbi:MAG: hypothetical protein EKK51_09675 [Mycolicibacterium sp.]|uniref:hypothetical protein n=1 Tax=Mycobacteriaceae TaxID=1762 RepID=UPI000FB69EE1|nr:hypothetical protein [Mycolicibacterium sp.]RUP32577.1 MAG: hypothetical protein EKK51_09675 [Mycolicibacterium sp.]